MDTRIPVGNTLLQRSNNDNYQANQYVPNNLISGIFQQLVLAPTCSRRSQIESGFACQLLLELDAKYGKTSPP